MNRKVEGMYSKYRIYNFYGKLVGKMEDWIPHLSRIKEMGFDWVYFNPISLPGKSKSDYSIADYYAYNPLFVGDRTKEEGDELFSLVCQKANELGLKVMLDIVINHTAIDSFLADEHPNWYLHDYNGNLISPSCMDGDKKIVWDDLAEIDNLGSSDKESLWNYWKDYILHMCKLGVRGFRCDAAYMVPFDLWKFLIIEARKVYPDTIFLGETLGCSPLETQQTAQAGFDLVMNGFKWWDFRATWFPEQFNVISKFAPSMAFPENHDTTRCAFEYNNDRNKVIMKYALCALICTSVAITIGFEFGFQRKIDVYSTNPSWYEKPSFDISKEIKEINKIKDSYQIFNEDNEFYTINFNTDAERNNLFGFTKISKDGSEKILVVANISSDNVCFNLSMPYYVLGNHPLDISYINPKSSFGFHDIETLLPGDVKIYYAKN